MTMNKDLCAAIDVSILEAERVAARLAASRPGSEAVQRCLAQWRRRADAVRERRVIYSSAGESVHYQIISGEAPPCES